MTNETVGEINDLVLDKDGKVIAVVVGVGGFLGVGEREVALDYKSLKINGPNSMTRAGATTIQVNATKDSLKNAFVPPARSSWCHSTEWGSSRAGFSTPATENACAVMQRERTGRATTMVVAARSSSLLL